MRELISGFIVGFALSIGAAALATNSYSEKEAANRTRACIPKDGHVTKLSVSASATTGDLGQNKVYRLVCTVAVYYEMTDDATATTADSNASYLPVDTIDYFATGSGDQSRYLSAVDIAATAGTCFITECE